MSTLRIGLSLLALLALSLHTASAGADHPTLGLGNFPAGPITTSAARVMDRGTLAVTLDTQHVALETLSDSTLEHAAGHGEHVHSVDALTRHALNFAWGLNPGLTVGASLPHVRREGIRITEHSHAAPVPGEHHHAFEAVDLGSSSGLGDISVFGVHQLQIADFSSTALLFGVKAPTGETDAAKNGERLETEFQTGTGAWDGFIGVAHSRLLGTWQLDTNVLYTRTTQGSQSTRLGDVFNYNLALSTNVLRPGEEHATHTHTHLVGTLVLEINGEWRDQMEIAGNPDANSGGNVVYFAPGVRLHYGEWLMSASVGFPTQHLRGIQNEVDKRALLRLTRMF